MFPDVKPTLSRSRRWMNAVSPLPNEWVRFHQRRSSLMTLLSGSGEPGRLSASCRLSP
jgi:hypothetical protein